MTSPPAAFEFTFDEELLLERLPDTEFRQMLKHFGLVSMDAIAELADNGLVALRPVHSGEGLAIGPQEGEEYDEFEMGEDGELKRV